VLLEAAGQPVPEEFPGEAERPAREQPAPLGQVERPGREAEEQQGPEECPAPGAKAVVRVQRGRPVRPALAAHRTQERQVRAGAPAPVPAGSRAAVRAVDSSKINAARVEPVQET
jgi:hypothetical protein